LLEFELIEKAAYVNPRFRIIVQLPRSAEVALPLENHIRNPEFLALDGGHQAAHSRADDDDSVTGQDLGRRLVAPRDRSVEFVERQLFHATLIFIVRKSPPRGC